MTLVRILWIVFIGLSVTFQSARAQARLITDIHQPSSKADTVRKRTGHTPMPHRFAPKKALLPDTLAAQKPAQAKEASAENRNNIQAQNDTLRLAAMNDSLMKANKKERKRQARANFVPDPKRALWLSLVLPGAGQIYNRKYWKLPIIYGGFLGCTYAFMWNQQMYRDYSQAYLDIMDDDPNTKSYMDMLPPRYDITGREEQFKNIFKRKKDYYRRYRDLSAFCFAGVYLLSVVDAYVDAQLSVFDISPELSMRLEPAVISTGNHVTCPTTAYGVGCSLTF